MMKVFGIVFAYTVLLLGVFLAIDAIVPKSKPISSIVLVGEFVVGVFMAGFAYMLIRRTRSGFRR